MPAPLIVTLALDEDSTARFDTLRRQWFPADRNHLAAHVTLFHALPGAGLDDITATVADAAHRIPFDVAVTGVRLLGRGVAYDLRSPQLDRLHAELAARWADRLTRQDRQPLCAHVTVQNKVAPAAARDLHARLSADFLPWTARAHGLAVWWYEGGPWRHVSTAPFPGGAATSVGTDRDGRRGFLDSAGPR